MGRSESERTERPMPPVPLLRPEPPPFAEIGPYYRRSQEAGHFANGGPCYELLVERMEAALGPDVSCVPLASGTAALVLALRALAGDRPGGEVLLPAYTFTASACAIEAAGLVPSFVDVEPDSWQMSPAALDRAMTRRGERVAGVLGCATFGVAPPVAVRRAWSERCREAGVPLLIDSAAGFGSRDEDGRPLGALGDHEVFSFHATKPFAIGEGGMLATPDAGLAARVARLANFGLDPDTRTSAEAGLNGKLSELGCATALAMLDRFDDVLRRRRASAARLREALAGLAVEEQLGAPRSAAQLMPVRMPSPGYRAHALELAGRLGVVVRTYHDPPLHRHPAFAGAPRDELVETDRLAAAALTLPMANDLGPSDVERIAECVRGATAVASRG